MCANNANGRANSVEPDKTSGSTLFVQTYLSKILGSIQHHICGSFKTDSATLNNYNWTEFKLTLHSYHLHWTNNIHAYSILKDHISNYSSITDQMSLHIHVYKTPSLHWTVNFFGIKVPAVKLNIFQKRSIGSSHENIVDLNSEGCWNSYGGRQRGGVEDKGDVPVVLRSIWTGIYTMPFTIDEIILWKIKTLSVNLVTHIGNNKAVFYMPSSRYQ